MFLRYTMCFFRSPTQQYMVFGIFPTCATVSVRGKHRKKVLVFRSSSDIWLNPKYQCSYARFVPTVLIMGIWLHTSLCVCIKVLHNWPCALSHRHLKAQLWNKNSCPEKNYYFPVEANFSDEYYSWFRKGI